MSIELLAPTRNFLGDFVIGKSLRSTDAARGRLEIGAGVHPCYPPQSYAQIPTSLSKASVDAITEGLGRGRRG
jgi:hypothetical protein